MLSRVALRSGRRRSMAKWLVGFLAIFAVLAAWSLASPLYSGPDEPAHVVRAASLVRGEVLGRATGDGRSPDTTVTVPAWLGDANSVPACFNGRVDKNASCEPSLPTGNRPIHEVTYTGRYPPLYGAIVGWPTLVASGATALRLMRLSGAAACAALLAGAGWCAVRSRRRVGLLIGLALAVTPQVLFLGAVVNPSGLEISAAICVWTAGLAVVEGATARSGRTDIVALSWLTVAAAIMVNTRGLSPLLLALIAAALFAAAGWRAGLAVLRTRAGKVSSALVVLASVAAVVWIFGAGALRTLPTRRTVHPTDLWQAIVSTAENVTSMAPQYLGVFGWVDTTLPVGLYVAGFAGGAVLIGLGLTRADRHRRRVALASAILCFVIPVALTVSQTSRLGVFGQARDWMPLWVGLPLLACQALGRLPESRRRRGIGLLLVAGSGAGVFQVLSWLRLLQRYRFGLGPGLAPPVARWDPPASSGVLLALLCVGLLVGAGAVVWRVARSTGPPPAASPVPPPGRRDVAEPVGAGVEL